MITIIKNILNMEEYNFLKFAYEIADMARISIENFFNKWKENIESKMISSEVNI